jgi:hypothetical protein
MILHHSMSTETLFMSYCSSSLFFIIIIQQSYQNKCKQPANKNTRNQHSSSGLPLHHFFDGTDDTLEAGFIMQSRFLHFKAHIFVHIYI